MDHANRVCQLLVVSSSDLLNSGFSVQSHSDSLVGLHELVQLFGQLLVLHGDHSDVVVQGVDLNLKIRVVIEQGRIAVPGTLQLLSHVHNLVLLSPDLGFKIFNTSGQFNVSLALGIDSLLKINIFISVFFLEGLQVIKLILETDDLIFQLDNLALALHELCLLALQVESLAVNELIEVIDPGKLLRDVVFERSRLGR